MQVKVVASCYISASALTPDLLPDLASIINRARRSTQFNLVLMKGNGNLKVVLYRKVLYLFHVYIYIYIYIYVHLYVYTHTYDIGTSE